MKQTCDIPVWDLPTRLFHWLLVLLVAGAWFSYKFGDVNMTWHKWNGYAVLTLLLFRLAWGIVGSSTARFGDFVKGPFTVLRYLRDGARAPSLGHNPAGGWSVLAMLTVLGVQAGAGLFTSDDILVSGPLNFLVSSASADVLSSIHRLGYYVLLGLVALHLAALVFHRLAHGENLVRAMITGRKHPDHVPPGAAAVLRPLWLAALCLVLAALAVWLGINAWAW
ncbi:cytochrome b/b6 domain-containing protein [Sulfurivermis fontis]|uniref:cytochrome b/b6 domain-containing protein n=1 Tax=Sulfurivermis fontis TaxID=1972068 RepID=UPI000FD8B830|nr:cytochrome b/b6 domain-containing protein [Sulfurivermis fontis]